MCSPFTHLAPDEERAESLWVNKMNSPARTRERKEKVDSFPVVVASPKMGAWKICVARPREKRDGTPSQSSSKAESESRNSELGGSPSVRKCLE